MSSFSKKIILLAISSLISAFFTSSVLAQENKDTNENYNFEDIQQKEKPIDRFKVVPFNGQIPGMNKKDNPDSKLKSDKNNNKQYSFIDENGFKFSLVNPISPVEITQLVVLDYQQLVLSGVTKEDIFNFVASYWRQANNYFYADNNGGKIVFAVEVVSNIENLDESVIEGNPSKYCSINPSECSITKISSFQNGKIDPVVYSNFERKLLNMKDEIFLKNIKYSGNLRFFFEISVKE